MYKMVYTHAWRFLWRPSEAEMCAFREDIVDLMPLLEKMYEIHTSHTEYVVFNDKSSDTTFQFPFNVRIIKPGAIQCFNTRYNTYEEALMLVLYMAKWHFGDGIDVVTDKDVEEWSKVINVLPDYFEHISTACVIHDRKLIIAQ